MTPRLKEWQNVPAMAATIYWHSQVDFESPCEFIEADKNIVSITPVMMVVRQCSS